MTETQQTINNVIAKMIAYSDGNKHDIAHFLKVYTYARMIGEMENLTERKQEILEIAAVIHDIACPVCRVKYGNTNGSNQEKESPELVENFLKDVEIDDEMKERINYLVSHHHTYTNVDGLDYRILLEADFLVNADESEMSENAVETARERVFETNTGKKLLTSINCLPGKAIEGVEKEKRVVNFCNIKPGNSIYGTACFRKIGLVVKDKKGFHL